MASKSNMFMTLLVIGIIGILVMGGIVVYTVMKQQTALQEEEEEEELTGPEALQGKAATISVYSYDQAADSPSTSHVAAPLYLFVGDGTPITQEDNKVSGILAADGTTLSKTARTDVTEGITVGSEIYGIATNSTYYGVWGDKRFVKTQSETYDVDVYTVAAGGGLATFYDEDGDSITYGTNNVSIGANDAYTFEKIKIENNDTDAAWNVAGFFIGENTGGNLTTYSMDGAVTGDYSGSISKDPTKYSLESRDSVDIVFVFDEPIMLLENDQIFTPSFTVESDGDGCQTAETLGTFTFFDANWVRSSGNTQAVIFAAETDAASPADIASGDYATGTIYCS